MSGASIAGLAGVGSVSATPSTAEEPEFTGEPQFRSKGKIGFAKGTIQNPVTPKTVSQIQETVSKNHPGVSESKFITHDPHAEDKEYQRREGTRPKKIIGYGMTWVNGAPNIRISYLPVTDSASMADSGSAMNQSSAKFYQNSYQNAYAKVDSLVAKGGGE
ncbi:hypothetical protein ACH9L7_16215 (plasmid) [Haloferax sp. S1W]|uniref:hypothetical protein n=1 Tax=Haloferax sp. S1W TaxID=3377110 RepID=UPI0037C53225